MLLGSKESPLATAVVALVYSAVITLEAFFAEIPAITAAFLCPADISPIAGSMVLISVEPKAARTPARAVGLEDKKVIRGVKTLLTKDKADLVKSAKVAARLS